MPTILCQLEAVLRFLSNDPGDSNMQACREGLRQAIAALRRHIQTGSSR